MKWIHPEDLRSAEIRALSEGRGDNDFWIREAGVGLADRLRTLLLATGQPRPPVLAVIGPGKNGLDGLVALTALARQGFPCHAWLLSLDDSPFRLEAESAGVVLEPMAHPDDWSSAPVRAQAIAPRILLDAVLGTGARGEPRDAVAAALAFLRRPRPDSAALVAVDLPSGWDGASPDIPAWTPRADFTVTMGYPKPAMLSPAGAETVGSFRVVPFSLPPADANALPDALPSVSCLADTDIAALLPPPRPRDSHKGTFGQLLLVGGCETYPGAAVLASLGALRGGLGLLRVVASPPALAALALHAPEAVQAGPLFQQQPALPPHTALLVGPGIGRSPEARRLLASCLYGAQGPLLLDADAISLLAGRPAALRACPQPVVVTPHPGELSSLLGISVEAVLSDRPAAARQAADLCNAVVVLKGRHTLVASPGSPDVYLNPVGGPGLACAGSGDVLAGLLGAFLAQGLAPLRAARLAVWLHGVAGDLASLRASPSALRASDIPDFLPLALQSLPRPCADSPAPAADS